jgi:hypothetical protein
MSGEDPFDQLCRLLVAFVFFLSACLVLVPQWLFFELCCDLRQGWLSLQLALFLPLSYKIRLLCSHFYYQHLAVWLMLFGLIKTPTWTEIEERRLQTVAKGADLPRWKELEEGLLQEQHELPQQ